MASKKQIVAAKKNIKKAQKAWQQMSHRQHALAQPQGRARQKPGTTGEGKYFRIVVRDKNLFTTFRYHDVGDTGHLQRLAGKRSSGSWDTISWLVGKTDAHIAGGKLIPDSIDAKNLFKTLGSTPVHVKGDVFKAKDRPNVPEADKPTPKQKRAYSENIKKAQKARRK